jgi:toxin ParE1/3/4
MSCVFRREAARRDLVDQFVWYAENASIEVADRFLAHVESTLERLATAPESGAHVAVTRRDLSGLRRWPVKGFESILLFYFPMPDGIDLVRVLHGSRNLLQLFEERDLRS